MSTHDGVSCMKIESILRQHKKIKRKIQMEEIQPTLIRGTFDVYDYGIWYRKEYRHYYTRPDRQDTYYLPKMSKILF